jgi:hypothetical protein
VYEVRLTGLRSLLNPIVPTTTPPPSEMATWPVEDDRAAWRPVSATHFAIANRGAPGQTTALPQPLGQRQRRRLIEPDADVTHLLR